LDREPFLAVHGVPTMSHSYQNLSAELAELQSIGIHHFRLSPHSVDMVAVADTHRRVLNRALSAEEADEQLQDLIGDVAFPMAISTAQKASISSSRNNTDWSFVDPKMDSFLIEIINTLHPINSFES